jgi:hypothetical protein
MGFSYFDLATLPKQYDIVWCLYPRREDKLAPGPVARPSLVLDARADTKNKRGALIVAYETGEFDERTHGEVDSIVDEWSEVHALGLHKPTRFALSLESRMLLPWCPEYFVAPSYAAAANVIAGALTKKQIDRLVQCLANRGVTPFSA